MKLILCISLLLLFGRVDGRIDSVAVDSAGIHFTAYMPTTGPRPLPTVFLIHGGGYQIGSRHDLALEARHLALMGYMAVLVGQRLGWDVNDICNLATGIGSAKYKSSQDLKAVMNHPGIVSVMDPQKVFLFGESSGAATVMLYNLKPEDWNLCADTSVWGQIQTGPKVLGVVVEQGQLPQDFLHRAQFHACLLISLDDHEQWFAPHICGSIAGGEAISKQLYAVGYCVWKRIRCDAVHDGWTHQQQADIMESFFGDILAGTCSNLVTTI